MFPNFKLLFPAVSTGIRLLAPVIRKADSAVHWINNYPLDSAIGFPNTYPMDSDLSDG